MNQNTFERLCLKYSDLSINNDHQLRLISSLVLGQGESLELRELKSLGQLFDEYLNSKLILDHHFWKGSLTLCQLSDLEIKARVHLLSMM